MPQLALIAVLLFLLTPSGGPKITPHDAVPITGKSVPTKIP